MKRHIEDATVLANTRINGAVFSLLLQAPQLAASAHPGQFVHIKCNHLSTPLLRRPFSIAGADRAEGTITIIYRVVGQGTDVLSRVPAGGRLNCLGPLGTGFSRDCRQPLLIGGGMGLAPLAFLAGDLCPRPITVAMGGRSAEELFWAARFAQVCDTVRLATDDGTAGVRGLVTDLLPEMLESGDHDLVYTCGPEGMMRQVAAIARQYGIRCQVSLEDYMACGLGGCLACTCAGTDGKRRKICTEGPVFWAEEVFSC